MAITLSHMPERDGPVFVQDLRANGLGPDSRSGEAFDIVSHDATRDIAYDGDWERQQLSQSVYRDMFARDAHRYGQLLQVVTAAIRRPAGVTATVKQKQVTTGAR
jgi:hypothetical protein